MRGQASHYSGVCGRRLRFLLCFLLLAWMLVLPARAAEMEEELYQELGANAVVDALPRQVTEILGEESLLGADSLDRGLAGIGREIRETAGSIFRQGLRSAVQVVMVVLLCAVAGVIYEEGAVPDFVPLAGVLAIAVIAAGEVHSFVELGRETLQTLTDFSRALLPCLTAAWAATGAVTAAAAGYAATALFMDVLLSVAGGLVLPLVYAYLAAMLAGAAMGGEGLRGCAGFLKTACTLTLTGLVIAFTAYLSLTGVVSGSADAVTMRLAKTTLSTALPVVGSILSDAAGTLVAGAALVRNSVGVLGLLAVLCVCLTPVLTLGVQYLLYKLAAALSAPLADKRLSEFIGGIGSAFGMVLAVIGAGAAFLFISIILAIRVVTGT